MKNIKKLTAFILTFILLIGVIPLSYANAESQTFKLGYIFETGVNIRADATTSSEKVDNVSQINVEILGSKSDTNQNINPKTNKPYIWYNISYISNSKNITGYVREDLITVTEYTVSNDFEDTLKAFPESYHENLKKLHAIYPNWEFIADKTPKSFINSVIDQDSGVTKLLTGTSKNSWRSMREGCYNWETGKYITTDGGRYGASREVIAYYMDPRNFLDANNIYIFMTQTYDWKTHTVEAIETLVDGTFLDGKVTADGDKYKGKRYAAVIRKAASESGVDAFVLASTIIQEHGTKGSTLSNGTAKHDNKTVYNFFNFGASGTTELDIIKNGSKRAYTEGWFTPTESIIGGAKKYASNYIAIGQNTYYYKNYNVMNPDRIWHQYAQNVADSVNSASRLKTIYSNLYNMELTFRIPVFEGLPSEISKLPEVSDKYNNYYFEKITCDGLSPAFDRYTNNYTLSVDGNKTLSVKVPSGAKYIGKNTYPLVKGKNKIQLDIQSQSGYTRTYTITVTAAKAATLTVTQEGGTLKKEADGKWYYYIDDQKIAETTLVKYKGKWFYIKDGVWDNTANTLVKYMDKWFYIKNGKWDNTATTLFKYNNKWFYIENGKWSNKANTLFKYNNIWFYIKNGKWYQETLIFHYNGKDFYVKKGKVDLTFSGKVNINGTIYKIKYGKVD